MKRFFTSFLILFSLICYSQNKLSNVSLKNLQGDFVNVSSYNKSENPVIVNFWATWCAPCLKELKAISKHYKSWKESFGVEFIAVSVDDSRTKNRVKPLVKGSAWEYTILFDENFELKQAMNVSNVPYSLIIHKGEIVFVHSGYTPGIENKIYEKLKEITDDIK